MAGVMMRAIAMRHSILSLAGTCLFALAIQPALAVAPVYSGTVNGTFSNPILTGNVINTDGTPLFENNTTSAFYVLTPLSPSNDTITWGNSTTTSPPVFSFLNFVGATYTNEPVNTPFLLGTISYLNGSSDLDTLIFGATLTMDLGNGIDVKTTNISIDTTANTGLSAARDADFVSFSGLPNTFNVVEGQQATADIYGEIVGDPTVTLTQLTLDPNSALGAGFIGNGVGGVPEPDAWMMLLTGFLGLGSMIRFMNAARRIQTAT
jgi:hypothetical protein